jgi:hypothetical protein
MLCTLLTHHKKVLCRSVPRVFIDLVHFVSLTRTSQLAIDYCFVPYKYLNVRQIWNPLAHLSRHLQPAHAPSPIPCSEMQRVSPSSALQFLFAAIISRILYLSYHDATYGTLLRDQSPCLPSTQVELVRIEL